MAITPETVQCIDARGRVLGAVQAEIVEVGGGGARLRVTHTRLAAGQRLALRFALADVDFDLTGRVAWTDEEMVDTSLIVGVGFDEIAAATRRQVVAAMNDHRRRHQPQAASRVATRLR